MIKWPVKAIYAIRALFEPLQDIDVYVEDTDDEPFYKSLLDYASNGAVRIARVFALNGRVAVVEAARRHNYAKRRALFIIDGDLEWVKGDSAPPITGLYRIDAYCIENLLLCEEAIAFVISQEKAVSISDAAAQAEVSTWMVSVELPLVELFAAYATLNHFSPSIATVSKRVGRLCSEDGVPRVNKLDSQKVRVEKDEVISVAEGVVGSINVAAKYAERMAFIQGLEVPLRAVSGKDYLLPLLHMHLNTLGCRIRTTALRMRLSCSGSADRFEGLANALEGAAKGLV